jgi:hypothetical protein
MEVYSLFKKEFPEARIKKSKFAALRPSHVLLSNKLPHNVCLCKYHENFIYAVNALHSAYSIFPAYSHDMPESFLCEVQKRECWFNECENCRNGANFEKKYQFDNKSVVWYVWKMENNKMMKIVEEQMN